MDCSDYYCGIQFESLSNVKNTKKKSKKKRRFFKKVKKFFKRVCDKAIDAVVLTISRVTLLYFDKKFEKVFA